MNSSTKKQTFQAFCLIEILKNKCYVYIYIIIVQKPRGHNLSLLRHPHHNHDSHQDNDKDENDDHGDYDDDEVEDDQGACGDESRGLFQCRLKAWARLAVTRGPRFQGSPNQKDQN